mmetsp:Transcript_4510/g.15096  ORF Transcript_4510/g.15096 Transcript_4510/m.15096 type:complete len:259 (-) Transcript_4510:70-846(-)
MPAARSTRPEQDPASAAARATGARRSGRSGRCPPGAGSPCSGPTSGSSPTLSLDMWLTASGARSSPPSLPSLPTSGAWPSRPRTRRGCCAERGACGASRTASSCCGTPPRTHLSSAPSWTRWTASWSSSACLGGAVAPELGSSCPIGVPLQPRAPSTERGGGGRLPHPLRAMLPRRVPALRGKAGAADRPRGLWRAARRRRLAGRAAARDRGEPRAVPRLQPADAVAVALHRPVQQAGREGSERAAGAAAAGLADVRL